MQRYTVSGPGGNAVPQHRSGWWIWWTWSGLKGNLERVLHRHCWGMQELRQRVTGEAGTSGKTRSSSLTENQWTEPLAEGRRELEFQRKRSIPSTVPSPSVCSCLYRTLCLPHGRTKCSVLWSSEGNMTLLISLKTAAHLLKNAPQAAPSSSL